MELNTAIVNQHQQLDDFSCIPMAVELVLKLLGRVSTDYYDLQSEWHNRRDGSFAAFNGRTVAGVLFRLEFGLARDDKFPLDDLFHTIDGELAAGRFVIISLANSCGWHMFVIHEKLASGEFRAVSRIPRSEYMLVNERVQADVRQMKGTDILTYKITGA